MTIRIIESQDDYLVNCDGREIRIEKPVGIQQVKKIAREHFDAVGEKVDWRILK